MEFLWEINIFQYHFQIYPLCRQALKRFFYFYLKHHHWEDNMVLLLLSFSFHNPIQMGQFVYWGQKHIRIA